ncbi:MAG: TetR family transcriptional regulator [Jatrophihabitans sp.]
MSSSRRPPIDRRLAGPEPGGVLVQSRAQRKERTRQSLLDGCLKLLTDRSLASLSLREVAREVGIVPTAFYRHFPSMDELGVALVQDSSRPLRQLIREARRQGSSPEARDLIADTVDILVRQVSTNPAQFRFVVRERYGGIAEVNRAIAAELRLFASELTVDLARLPGLRAWSTDDLKMAADLMVAAMLATVQALLEVDNRYLQDREQVISRARRQLRLIVLGMAGWRSDTEDGSAGRATLD